MNILLFKQILLHSIGAFGGTLGYAFLLNAPLCTVLPASLTGLLGYVLYAEVLRENTWLSRTIEVQHGGNRE